MQNFFSNGGSSHLMVSFNERINFLLKSRILKRYEKENGTNLYQENCYLLSEKKSGKCLSSVFISDVMILLSVNFRKILLNQLAKFFGCLGNGKVGETNVVEFLRLYLI